VKILVDKKEIQVKVTSVTARKELKFSQNYNSAGSSIEMTASVDEHEDGVDVYTVLSQRIEDLVEEDLRRLIKVLP
jgi:hypothetical protein